MVKAPRYLPDILITAALAVLATVVAVPWPLREPSAARSNNAGFTPVVTDRTTDPPRPPSARSVAGLFGYRAPAPAPARTEVRPTVSVRPPDQLKYLGHVVTGDGRTTYSFKNTRSGRVLSLVPGRDNGRGWKLVSVTSDFYIIHHNETVYKIPK
jgi:hypothetical protein